MPLLPIRSLRFMLTVPYLALVLLIALIIGILSYRAGSNAVDELSDLVLNETVNRISQAVDKHISGSEAVLETAFPVGIEPPVSLRESLRSIRQRLWLATSIHRNLNNYAYYGDHNGEFVGLWRSSASEAELRLRNSSNSPRLFYNYTGILGELENPAVEPRSFEPRDRPWFKAGQAAQNQAWTDIYIDFKSQELVGTRTRRIDNSEGEFRGVVATDVSLQHLNEFLKTLPLSTNGVAFIVERDGKIIAASRGPHILRKVGKSDSRLNAVDSSDPLIPETFRFAEHFAAVTDAGSGTQTTTFESMDGSIIQAGYSRLHDSAGLDWLVAVAIPREDFMHKVTRNVHRTVGLAVLACVLIFMLGFFILSRVAADLRQLAGAARAMGDGDLNAAVPLQRSDEIGELALSFSNLQQRLLTDRLTGIANREAIIRRIEGRIEDHRRHDDRHPFALLYIDLDGFKAINDRFGHDAGDQVLVEVAKRLENALRDYDMAARYGGDEFVVLLDKALHRDIVAQVCERLQAALCRPYDVIMTELDDPAYYSTGASIGYALYPEDGEDLESLIKFADKHMYSVKTATRKSRG